MRSVRTSPPPRYIHIIATGPIVHTDVSGWNTGTPRTTAIRNPAGGPGRSSLSAAATAAATTV
ncbi:hypothetical protein GCM10009557_44010 [Virgisporangium ochraceum]|uniref:Uncharacterized protein n=1 Tax=Virgisporangium ochraceum TaxID=65505 RepID=A0A8J3ZYY3_9ACTN|nr:hypothetical protein Voc01_076510 [Virgisporangium ochraceum]